MNDLSFYNEVCFKIDSLLAENGVFGEGSLEGLNSNIIGRLFVSVVDTFGQLLCTFTTNLTKFTKSLKRSEIHEWCNSNLLKVRVVESIPYANAIGIDVDVPANMKGKYLDVTTRLIALYGNLNAVNTSTLVVNTFTDVLKAINNNSKTIAPQISSAASVIKRVMSVSKPAVDKVMGDFDDKFSYKVKFEKAFLTMKELADTRSALLDAEPFLQDVSKLKDMTQSMETTCKEIVDAINVNEGSVTSRDLMVLAEIAKSSALVMNAYGMAATRQMMLEHNLILVYNRLYDVAK